MSGAVLEAGNLAKSNQGKVKNIVKKIEDSNALSEREKYIQSAQTEIDIKSQEILIKAAKPVLPANTTLDAEEKSPSVGLFTNQNPYLTLVLDPIDGTAEYLAEKDEYSICVGLILEGEAISALIYYPNLDILYYINEKHQGCIDNHHSISLFKNARPLDIKECKSPNRVFLKSYSKKPDPQSSIENLLKYNFDIKTSIDLEMGDSEILRKLISGEGLAFLTYSIQVRDLLLGAVIQSMEKGYAIDLSGNELIWPQGGAVKEAIFGVGEIPGKIIEALT